MALGCAVVFAHSGGETRTAEIAPYGGVAAAAVLPEAVSIRTRPGEPVQPALLRAGLTAVEAESATLALAEVVDVANGAALALDLQVLRTPRAMRLASLRVRGQGAEVLLTRTGGGFETRVAAEQSVTAHAFAAPPPPARPSVIEGPMETVLYGSADGAQATASEIAQAVQLFAHKLDFGRDIRLGDRVRLVVGGASAGQARDLLYAEVAGRGPPIRFYRHQSEGGGKARYLDEEALSEKAFLMRTPIKDARVSSGFGPRLHPILGYTRMHQGVDFAAPSGAPVVAAADGVVAETGWSGGYGRIVRLRHASGVETLYAHLSGWAGRLPVGATVGQGDVIGYVGSSGLATGPHLHYEVSRDDRRLDPRAVKTIGSPGLTGPERAAFDVRRREIDALLARPPSTSVATLRRIGAVL